MSKMETDAPKVLGKKKPNKLIVEEATADDNSVIGLNSATMDTLELFRYFQPPRCPTSFVQATHCHWQ